MLALVGPTAVGKTEASLEVAERLGCEIVSLDSMQVYRGMDIGTAKPGPVMRARVRHHMIDLHHPSHPLTVAEYQALARDAIEDVARRGLVPLLVGGSGLYFRAVVDPFEFPPTAEPVRARLESEAEELGAETLHGRLNELDPAAAARIDPGNARRTVRALEVIELTGRPFSEGQEWAAPESLYDLRVAGLARDRAALFRRVEDRARAMLADGLVAEVEGLARQGLGPTAVQALGYRQVLEREPGKDEEALVQRIVRATKKFARRQESWFRGDPRVRWFDAGSPDLVSQLLGFFMAEDDPGSPLSTPQALP